MDLAQQDDYSGAESDSESEKRRKSRILNRSREREHSKSRFRHKPERCAPVSVAMVILRGMVSAFVVVTVVFIIAVRLREW